ncbi:MAG: hypothetical protein PUD64_01700 [Bacteroidales bacterium]|nr:hypothetical protein [Bacteroidales bacterium]
MQRYAQARHLVAFSRCSHRIVAVLSHHLVAFVGRYRPSAAAMMTGGVHFRHPGGGGSRA